jgi:multidrug efflux system membrane fusion protein
LSLSATAIFVLQGCSGAGSTTHAAPQRRGEGAVPVVVTTVSQKDVPIDIQVIGNVEAYSTITVRAQVGGQLTEAHFHEGDYVKKNDRLFSIDPRPYQGQLNQAEANLAHDIAALSQAEANLARDSAQERYAQTQATRYESLFKEGVMSRDQTDQIRSNADALAQAVNADKAAIESAKAQVASAKSSVENAKVQLSYTSIVSPIDGRTGNLTVKQGNLVAANTMDLMTINEVSPIYVTFSVPESDLQDIKRFMAGGKLPVIAAPQNDASARETGLLTFIDNAVDMTTGTIKLKGTFENKDRALWPGQFVRVTLRLRTQPNALVLPNQAVQTGQEGQFVYVVKSDKTVEFRPVVTGARIDQDLVIEKGVQRGETVVTEGQLRLAPGAHVQLPGERMRPNNAEAPGPRNGPPA